MAENYSHLQKLCLDTIQSGAIGAFIELFRLTHMEQPLGNNQPQSFEDLIGTAGAEAPQLAPQFSFDSPLGMPLGQLQILQQLLQQADNAGLERDLFQQFCCLSAVSDFFLQNHKLRLRVKMLPLVLPYPQYVQLLTSKLDELFRLVDSPDFNLPIQEEDPLVAAVSKLKNISIQKQTFPPIVISYAVRARNCLFEYLQTELQGYDITELMPLLSDADLKITAQKEATLQVLPEALLLKFLTLLVSCFLRLAVSLQQFNLFRAAYQIFQLFLKAVQLLEQKLKVSFSELFACGTQNGYQRLLKDEQINVDPEKKDDNLAFASLALSDVPALYETVLDRRQIPCLWQLTSESKGRTVSAQETFQNLKITDCPPTAEVERTTSINHRQGTPQDLCEIIYAGRQMAIMNCVQLACQIHGQQAMSTEGIEIDTSMFDGLLRGSASSQESGSLTVSQLADPELPIRCSYQEFLISISLLYKAVNLSLDCKIYSPTLPAFKRFAELCAISGLYRAVAPLCKRVASVNTVFEINALAWEARFARLEGRTDERLKLLEKRLEVSKKAAQESQEYIGFVVSAASELVFNSPGHDVSKMEEAWNDLQRQNQQLSNAVIEARVRFGAVRGAAQAQAQTSQPNSPALRPTVEEGKDEDLDDAVFVE